MNYPEIRFRHSWLLIETIYHDIKPAYQKPKDELYKLEYKFIQRTLNRYKKAWQPYEDTLIRGMCELLDLEFRQNTIDIYAAPFYRPFSDPMFIATKYTSDRAIEVIAHEILHRLLTDNTKIKDDMKLLPKWKALFGREHSFVTPVHIPVHAMLQSLFDDVLNEPQRTIRDKKMCKKWPDYDAAWKYVDEVGYKTVIDQLRESYKKVSEQQRV